MLNLFQEKTFFRLSLGFVLLSLFLLLIFGFSLIFSQKVKAASLEVPRLDSDGDGILDFYENNVYGTDPSNPDTDGDGYHDDQELMWGHDPLNSDSQAKYLLSTFSPFLRTSDAYVSRHLTVKGNLVADDLVKIAKDLEVFGPATFYQNVKIQGQINFQGSISNQGKQPVTVRDSLKVTQNLKVKKTITTKNLVVTSNMTVEDMTLGRGGKNRPAVGGQGGKKPLVIAGRKLATGDWAQVGDPIDQIYIRAVPDGGTVYFPEGVKFAQNPVITFNLDSDGVRVRTAGVEKTYLQSIIDTNEMIAIVPMVDERILSSDQKVIGFKYRIFWLDTKSGAGGGSLSLITADAASISQISWMAYGYEG